MTWRGWLAFTAAGSAGALACRGDWLAAAVVSAVILLAVAWRVRRALYATRATLRTLAEMTAVAATYSAVSRPSRPRSALQPRVGGFSRQRKPRPHPPCVFPRSARLRRRRVGRRAGR